MAKVDLGSNKLEPLKDKSFHDLIHNGELLRPKAKISKVLADATADDNTRIIVQAPELGGSAM